MYLQPVESIPSRLKSGALKIAELSPEEARAVMEKLYSYEVSTIGNHLFMQHAHISTYIDAY